MQMSEQAKRDKNPGHKDQGGNPLLKHVLRDEGDQGSEIIPRDQDRAETGYRLARDRLCPFLYSTLLYLTLLYSDPVCSAVLYFTVL